MKSVVVILIYLWLIFWIIVGFGLLDTTPEQIKKDKNFVQTQIKPSVDFVKNFKILNNRLPTNREYYTWESGYYNDYTSNLNEKTDSLIPGFGGIHYIRKEIDIPTDDQSKFKDADWTKDFAISVWRGEWMEYYYSKNDNYDTNNYSWSDGFISLFVCLGVGLVPIVFWYLLYQQKKEKQPSILS